MNTQTLDKSIKIGNGLLSLAIAPAAEPIHASSLDYGFDFDDEELASELLASIPQGAAGQPATDGDEYCALWFLS